MCLAKPVDFFANTGNKVKLIMLLSQKLRERGVSVRQARADADVLIVSTAIDLTNVDEHPQVVIVGEDTDLVVLLVALVPDTCDILLLKPCSGKDVDRVYSSRNLQVALGPLREHIAFAHAISGCDTTSAPFGRGKRKAIQLLEKNPKLREQMSVFNDRFAEPEAIAKAGEIFLLALYGADRNVETLDKLRFYMYNRTIGLQSLSKVIQLARLPPTSAAARQHSFRTFHQVQQWFGVELPATQWGWKMKDNSLHPNPTSLPPAPDYLLNLICCNCKSGRCTSCQCRKAGLRCTAMCGQCRGLYCGNAEEI